MLHNQDLLTSNICEHLKPLEDSLIEKGYKITTRGQVWSQNCREWVYFDFKLIKEEILRDHKFADCIEYHEHHGTHDGSEAGFICNKCKDGVMGIP